VLSDAFDDALIDLETTVRHIDETKHANAAKKAVLKDLAETQSERKTLRAERAALTVERDKLQAERDRLTRELQTERDRLTRELQIAGDEKTAIAQELAGLKKSLADRFAEISQLTRLLLDSEREFEISTKQLDQSAKQIERDRLEIRRLRQQVRTLMARSSLRTRLGLKSKLIKMQLARIEASELFDESWYESEYPDVKGSGCQPAEHYLLHGAYEGRNPGPGFDSKAYLDENPDVEEQGVNPLVHYLEYGRSENRLDR
jgi:chromosome segregation ATPase